MTRALAASVAALALAPTAAAELVTGKADSAGLAVTRAGSPVVAFTRGPGLVFAARGADGTWTFAPAVRLPSGPAAVVGTTTRAALVESPTGRWLALALRGKPVRVLARAPAGGALGTAGLTSDRTGRPVVAYAVRFRNGTTSLRLIRGGRTHRITRGGFPRSDVPPAAAPVLTPDGRIRVLELYGGGSSALIEWRPTRGDWVGQFLYLNTLTAFLPLLRAAVHERTVYAAWADAAGVLVTTRTLGGDASRVLPQAALVALASTGDAVEVAGNEWRSAGSRTVAAGLFGSLGAAAPVELDGPVIDFAAAGDMRQFLFRSEQGLTWYETQGRPTTRVSLSATRQAGGVSLDGRVEGGAGGSVGLYRETAAGRILVTETTPAPDGSFHALDPAPVGGLYRAVYADPSSGLPYASLVEGPD